MVEHDFRVHLFLGSVSIGALHAEKIAEIVFLNIFLNRIPSVEVLFSPVIATNLHGIRDLVDQVKLNQRQPLCRSYLDPF